MTQLHDCRLAFASTLETLAEQDSRIVVLTNDATSSSKLSNFAECFPRQFVNVGIAEQNMVGMASGMANAGKIAFVSGAACFLTGRATEQIKADLAYSDRHVILCGMSSGVAYGELGPTHHSIEDVPWMRAIANMTIVVPADPTETAQAVRALAQRPGPAFLRISRMGVPDISDESYQFEIGKASTLRQGTDITLIANGTMVIRALDAAGLLASKGVRARVINMSTIKPLDTTAIVQAAQETQGIVTIEEGTTLGGLGGAVAEVVVQNHPVPMRILGFPGVFAPTGSVDFLFQHFGLTPENIAAKAMELLQTT